MTISIKMAIGTATSNDHKGCLCRSRDTGCAVALIIIAVVRLGFSVAGGRAGRAGGLAGGGRWVAGGRRLAVGGGRRAGERVGRLKGPFGRRAPGTMWSACALGCVR